MTSDMTTATDYVDLNEMARRTKMSRIYFYRLVASGQIPAIRLGRVWRVSGADFESWLRRQNPYETRA